MGLCHSAQSSGGSEGEGACDLGDVAGDCVKLEHVYSPEPLKRSAVTALTRTLQKPCQMPVVRKNRAFRPCFICVIHFPSCQPLVECANAWRWSEPPRSSANQAPFSTRSNAPAAPPRSIGRCR